MKKTIILISIVIFLIIVIVKSCDKCTNIVCGKLDKEHQELIDFINTKYKNYFVVEPVPCESNYLNLILLTDNLDSILINEVHQSLYGKNEKIGWTTFLIYNKKKEYIISHSKTNQFYYQSGD
jgi:hypothetical protein